MAVSTMRKQKEQKIYRKIQYQNWRRITEIILNLHVTLLTFVFEKIVEVSINEFGINLLHIVYLLGFTVQCRLKYLDIN